jgi:hypothetical protein
LTLPEVLFGLNMKSFGHPHWFEAAETAQQSLKTGNNTEVEQFKCEMTRMRLCAILSSPSALCLICFPVTFCALMFR